VFNA